MPKTDRLYICSQKINKINNDISVFRLQKLSLGPFLLSESLEIRNVDAICGMSLLLVFSLAPRGFSPGAPQKPTLPNSKSIWHVRRRLNKFIRTSKCFVGKRITITGNVLMKHKSTKQNYSILP